MMKVWGLCVTILLFTTSVLGTADTAKPENPYVDEHGRDKASASFDQFFAQHNEDLFTWFATSSVLPRTWSKPGEEGLAATATKEAAADNVAMSEPRTDGQGLKIPQNRKNIALDWAKGDPNDPNVLFKRQLGFPNVAHECLEKRKYYYRTYDGSCNWVDEENYEIGKAWWPYQRDTPAGTEYSSAVPNGRSFVPYSRPIETPNPRSLSTTFFANKTGFEINHTPVLTGLIEFIIHDVSWSDTSKEVIEVPIPCPDSEWNPAPCEGKDEKLHFHVTKKVKDSTGLDRTVNGATTWVDGSQIYGVDEEQNKRLRSGIHGKLKVQQGKDGDYIAFSTNPKHQNWFDGGDPRVNQDWYVTAIQTLWVREHNRLADIMVNLHPDWNDEQVFLTVREVVTCKMFLIALAYMKGYFVMSEMKKIQWIDDNLQLVRLAYGNSYLEVNPLMDFAQLGLAPNGKHPAVASDEMSVGYRFHDLIPANVPLVGEDGKTFKTVDFMDTIYTPEKFLEYGMDAILRGSVQTVLPGFHSGVQPSLRNANFNLGDPHSKKKFDIAMWSIMRERTRGIPTFNEYFRYWNSDNRHLQVKIREKFADFTSNQAYADKLAEYYNTPDDVDLVVGLQLDEELFPGMQIPKSFVLVSLLSLYSLGISDRHGPLFNLVACLKHPNTLQDCRTTSALQDLLWKPNKKLVNFGSPNSKLLDMFWFNEIDYEHQGILALWRLVTENSGVKCAPLNPLFMANLNTKDPKNPYNPNVCSQDEWKKEWKEASKNM